MRGGASRRRARVLVEAREGEELDWGGERGKERDGRPGAESIANRGTFEAATEGLPFEFWLKVTAVDEAGNVGSAL